MVQLQPTDKHTDEQTVERTPITEPQPIQLRNPRLQNGFVYLLLILLVAIAIAQYTNPISLALIVSACIGFGLIQQLAFHRLQTQGAATLYLLAQSALVTTIFLLSGANDPFLFPFFVLATQAMLLLTPRSAAAWIIAFFAIGALGSLLVTGRVGVVYFLFYAAAYTFCGVFGYTLRQAEVARRQNELLLEELRQAQTQLQTLAVAEERNRMARDLHDSTKQQAFALSAQLDAVLSLLQRDPQSAERHLHQAVELADSLRQELAAMILNLRPPRLARLGLAQLLCDYTNEWAHQNAINAKVTIEGKEIGDNGDYGEGGAGESALTAANEEALFRIAQEALSNVARHSQAQTVDLRLLYTSAQVKLTIQDDGCGFDPYKKNSGQGQQNMRERAAALPQGRLTIVSKPGCGATVTVWCAI